jgi:hypothetical protein
VATGSLSLAPHTVTSADSRQALSLSLHLVERGGVAVGVLDAVLDLASSLAHLLRDVEDTAHIEATRAAVGHLPLDHCTTA